MRTCGCAQCNCIVHCQVSWPDRWFFGFLLTSLCSVSSSTFRAQGTWSARRWCSTGRLATRSTRNAPARGGGGGDRLPMGADQASSTQSPLAMALPPGAKWPIGMDARPREPRRFCCSIGGLASSHAHAGRVHREFRGLAKDLAFFGLGTGYPFLFCCCLLLF